MARRSKSPAVTQLSAHAPLESASTEDARMGLAYVCRAATASNAAIATDAVVFAMDLARMARPASTLGQEHLTVVLIYQPAAMSSVASVFRGVVSWINLVQMARIATGERVPQKHPPVTARVIRLNSATLRRENASAVGYSVAPPAIPTFLFALEMLGPPAAVFCLERVVFSRDASI